MTGITPELARRALEVARLAPSAHNTQPWRVELDHGGKLVVSVDRRRHLERSDPLERDLSLAMGGFVEAVRIGLAGLGVRGAVVEAPRGAFAAIEAAAPSDLAPKDVSLVRQRQTSRLAYSPREPEAAALEALVAVARAQGHSLHLVPKGNPERTKLEELFFAAAREAWLDPRSVRELRAWTRFDPEGARRPAEGLSTHCLGLGTADALAMMALLRDAPWRAAGAVFVAPFIAEALAREEARPVADTPFLAIIVGERDARQCGAGLLRTWLAATELRLALHPLSVLLDRRGWELARHLGVAPDQLVFACRLGRSAPPPRAGRLAVERFAKI